MALKPVPWCLLVSPTGSNDEREVGQLTVVENVDPEERLLRGVVVAIGAGVPDAQGWSIEVGNVVHYESFRELQGWHIVGLTEVVAYEDDA